MTQLIPIATAHGAQTVPKSGTNWVGNLIDYLSKAQRDDIMYVKSPADVPVSYSIAVDATGGTWDLVFGSYGTEADIAFNVAAATLKAAIVALDAAISAADLTVAGGPGDDGGTTPYVITLLPTGALYGNEAPTVTTVPDNLTGGAGTAAVTTTTA